MLKERSWVFALSNKYLTIAQNAVQKATSGGAAMAEAFLLSSKELSIETRDGEVETMKLAEDRGMGIRVITDGRVGFAYTTDFSSGGVDQVVHQALANGANTEPDTHYTLPQITDKYPQLDIYDPAIRGASVENKIKMAVEMEKVAKAHDNRVKIIESSSYQDGEMEVSIVNSLGMQAHYQGTYCGIYLSLVAGEGEDSQTGFAMKYGLKYADLEPIMVGKKAAERAVRMLGAKPVKTQRAAVVLDPYIATNFLGLLSPALSGEAVQKGRSLFGGKVGQQVAGELVSVVDDGRLKGGIASAPFDGEGVPTSETVLIEQGQLKGFLHNTYTAAKEGIRSTGNGVRGSFKSTPEVGTTNFFIRPGQVSADQIIQEVKNGLYVTEVMGMHTANPISGDFSLGAAGIWIENGALTKPVRGVAIAGNIMELLGSVDAVGNDLEFFGGKGSPTLRVASMSLSGS
ncbi:peptidase U62, modulator of DNA gyrase [Desulforamulus reducens MI-1]|uniref:Peptidase U62, modulator of DNA gyrase n=1 Tax=Desulforamulus reducens (strain ATCC BAA-1160 / DSM 100696 / MI-1) TaxID=349161 RepID=A4J3D1_DESRM|nr:TldD/PmbA family protein [Desulforamulus reducens]ABO49584.1 peptidase U62, modulator of DNA gyrase [Desulforamulus reducens MI-1]